MGVVAGNRGVLESDYAGRRLVHSTDAVEEGRFTGSVGTDYREDFSRIERKINFIESDDSPKMAAQPLDFQYWSQIRPSFRSDAPKDRRGGCKEPQ